MFYVRKVVQSRPVQHAKCSAPAGTRPYSALDIAGATAANDGAVDRSYSQKHVSVKKERITRVPPRG